MIQLSEKKEFKNIKVDSDTFDKIAHIAKALGKKKAQTVREIFDALYEVSGENPMLLKIIKNPMRDAVVLMFYPNKTYTVSDEILTVKAKVKKHE